MQAIETKFQAYIEGTKQYVVPLFQRPYSWLDHAPISIDHRLSTLLRH